MIGLDNKSFQDKITKEKCKYTPVYYAISSYRLDDSDYLLVIEQKNNGKYIMSYISDASGRYDYVIISEDMDLIMFDEIYRIYYVKNKDKYAIYQTNKSSEYEVPFKSKLQFKPINIISLNGENLDVVFFDKMKPINNSFVAVKVNQKWGFLRVSDFELQIQYNIIADASHSVKCYQLTNFEYDKVSNYKSVEGHYEATVIKGNKSYTIDETGTIIFKLNVDGLSPELQSKLKSIEEYYDNPEFVKKRNVYLKLMEYVLESIDKFKLILKYNKTEEKNRVEEKFSEYLDDILLTLKKEK